MKKILIIAAGVLCSVAVYVGVNSYSNNSQSDLMTKNLEALTQGESGDKGTLYSNQAGDRFCCRRDSERSCSAAPCQY